MPEQRRCIGCGTKYESFDEFYMGGFCPNCGSYRHEPAIKSDYRLRPRPEPELEPKKPELGSTEDYLGE